MALESQAFGFGLGNQEEWTMVQGKRRRKNGVDSAMPDIRQAFSLKVPDATFPSSTQSSSLRTLSSIPTQTREPSAARSTPGQEPSSSPEVVIPSSLL